ncbi:MAG TPA: hypothetical protein VFP78_01785 [Solirubrobacteraceae bacterium]|nr:hypothetical protein [Solirubrobacteraceae bacterium]
MAAVDPNQHDTFVLRQWIRLVINQYEFSLADDEPPFCFVEQARFKFKEDIRFFADDSKSVELLRIKARQRFDPRATYDITGPDGQKIGEIQKVFGASLLRSTFAIRDGSGEIRAQEKSLGVALFRRLVGFIPYVDIFANWLPIPYHFTFERDGKLLGEDRRRIGKFRDVYDIDLSGDPERTVDRRMILAAAVGMDALQAR